MSDIFEGFESSNTTAVPDILFDELLSKLSGAEIKVLLYIIRRTAGFKKTTDAISLSQFEKGIITHEGKVLDKGCGLNRETICKALQSLEKKGCIKTEKRTAKKRDKDTTLYSIRFKGDAQVVGKSDHVPSRKSELPNLVGKSDYGSRKTSKMVVGKSDLQDTVIQDTDKQDVVDAANADIDAQTSFEKDNHEEETSQQDIHTENDNLNRSHIANTNEKPTQENIITQAEYTTPDEYAACLQVFLEALGTQWKAMDKAIRGLWSAYKQEKLEAWKAINPKPTKPKPVLLAEEKALQHELQEWINTKRGYKLHGRAPAKEIFAEQNAVQTLAHMLYEQLIVGNEEDGATWEELNYEWEHIKKHDPYWSKPDNRVRIGGFALLQKFAPVIHEYRSTRKRTSNDTGNTTPKQETTSVLGVSGQRHFEFAPLPFRKAR